jgi:transposase InsO family protein
MAIMDWATRKVLAWRLSITLDASHCVEALKEAIAQFGKLGVMNMEHLSAIGPGECATSRVAIHRR